MVKKLIILSLVFLGLVDGLFGAQAPADVAVVTAHVFVHGTRFSVFSLFSARSMLKDQLRDCHFYKQVICESRNDPRFYDSQVMLDKGLVCIPQETFDACRRFQLSSDESRKAAVQVISGYDTLVRARQPGEHVYYTFGWDGLLSDKSRRDEALVLYNALINVRDQLSQQFPQAAIKFILHGHSHGGNVILYLAHHENEIKKNLLIDTTVLYGTPMQVETAGFCQHPLFKKIIIIFSEGDNVQIADKFSTASGSSRRTFTRVLGDYPIKQQGHVIELCASAAGNKNAFGHTPFYCMGVYGRGITPAVEQVFAMIRPFPVVLFAPVFLDMLATVDIVDGVLDFDCSCQGQCRIILSSGAKIQTSCDLVPLIKPMREVLEKSWEPHAIYGNLYVGGLAALHMFKAIPSFARRRYMQIVKYGVIPLTIGIGLYKLFRYETARLPDDTAPVPAANV